MSGGFFELLGSSEEGRRALAVERLKFSALTLLHETLSKVGISQSELARRLGIRKSAVNQTLNSDGAMKFSTFAEYLDAMGYEAEIVLHPRGTMRLRAQMDAPRAATVEEWQLLKDDLADCSTESPAQALETQPATVHVRVEEWTERAPEPDHDRNG